jgi:DNA-binding MarR family transcriptional regulator
MSNWNSRFSDPEQSHGFLLWQVSSLWRRQIESVLSPLGLTHLQFVLLANLAWLEHTNTKKATQADLSKNCKIDVNTTSQVLRTLEKKEYIERVRQGGDERSKFPALTESGRELVKKALVIVENEDQKFFQRLTSGKRNFFKNFLKDLLGF